MLENTESPVREQTSASEVIDAESARLQRGFKAWSAVPETLVPSEPGELRLQGDEF